MASCVLVGNLSSSIQVTPINNLLPSSLFEDAMKIQTSKKDCWQRHGANELLLVGTYIGLTTLENIIHSSFPFSKEDPFQDPQWVPETVGGTEPYVYYAFSHEKV